MQTMLTLKIMSSFFPKASFPLFMHFQLIVYWFEDLSPLFKYCFYFCFQEETHIFEEPIEPKSSTPLPVLCVEDGNVILRFSEIFAIQEPLKKAAKREQRFSVSKGIKC